MFRIVVFLLLLIMVIGCYPPSYYDYWNAGSTARYMDTYDYYYPRIYSYYYPYDYPYYYWYPYPYSPFYFSLSYSYLRYHHDYPYNYHRWNPYHSPYHHWQWHK